MKSLGKSLSENCIALLCDDYRFWHKKEKFTLLLMFHPFFVCLQKDEINELLMGHKINLVSYFKNVSNMGRNFGYLEGVIF